MTPKRPQIRRVNLCNAVVAVTASAAAFVTSAAGCLPGDTRPAPERVDATVEPGPGLMNGIETVDGWRITFDRFVLAAGNIDFENDDIACNSYAEARYDRLFDFAVVKDRQKLGTAYGLGTCRVEFRLRAPSFDALLGPGATAADVAFMRVQATDRFTEEADRVSLLAIGSASRGEESKRFEWVFRQSYELTDCKAEGGGFLTTLTLTEGATSELRLEVRPEELFRATPDDGAELRFQPMADSDADADGVVTLDELSKRPPPVVETGGLGGGLTDAGGGGDAGDGGDGGDGESSAPVTLEALVYESLLPRVLRAAGGGACVVEERRGGR